jgi:hypothetical protein
MAAIPSVTETVLDGGLGITDPVAMTPVVFGVTSGGVANTVYSYSTTSSLKAEQVQGPAVEAVAHLLDNSGGPVLLVKLTGSVAAANSSVTKSGSGPAVTVSGASNGDYSIRLVIVAGGALGTGTFKYCCDDAPGLTDSDRTYSETLTIPSGGTFAIPNTGITATFPTGTYVAGESYSCDAKCAGWNASDLAAGFVALAASTSVDLWRFALAVTSKGCGDTTAHALLATALQTQLTALATKNRYRRGIIASGIGDTASAVAAAFASVAGDRILVAHGLTRRASSKPFPGFAYPTTSSAESFAQRAAKSLPSTDLKRVKSGPLDALLSITHNEDASPSSLDSVRVSTLRTWQGKAGFFITQGRLKTVEGSDFDGWQKGILMDIACETAHKGMVDVVGSSVRTRDDGTIDEADAKTIETEVGARLAAKLLTPFNAEGTPGYVSKLRFRVDRTVNINRTGKIVTRVGIRPLGYANWIEQTLGYAINI